MCVNDSLSRIMSTSPVESFPNVQFIADSKKVKTLHPSLKTM